MILTFSKILIIGMVYFIGAASAYLYFNKRKNSKNNLQLLKKDVKLKKASHQDLFQDDLRNSVVDQLSRQKLVFSEEEKCWIRLRQIN